MCAHVYNALATGDEVPQTLYRGFAPGPQQGTSVARTPLLFDPSKNYQTQHWF